MNAKELLTRKVGPLPVYGWMIGVGGGLLIAAWIRRAYSGSDPAAAAIDGEAEDADYIPPTDGTGGAAVSDPNVFPDSNTGGPRTPQPPRTNNAWRKDAIRAGIAFGFGAIGTQRIIDKYLTGGNLTEGAAAKVNRIIAQVGPPPTATPSPQVKHDKPKHQGRPKTNGAWKDRGVAVMGKAGYNRDRVRDALSRYLAGKDLTGIQRNIVHDVIARIGPAPRPPRRQGHHGRSEREAATPTARRDTGANL